jgi:hypothetical protein
LTSERASDSIDYWRATAQELLSDSEASHSSHALASYSKLVVGHANLFAEHSLSREAEEAYRIATGIFPANVEAVTGLSELLTRTGRPDEAHQLLDGFIQNHPTQQSAVEESAAWMLLFSQPAGGTRGATR